MNRQPSMSAAEFAAKWLGSTRNERAAAQEHFIDLCHVLGVATPNEDPTGEWYAFEKGADKTDGGDGFADVWLRDHFGWEYKGKHHDLDAAYRQLLQYREALGNPPLLVVCDLDRFVVHTNFNNTEKRTYEFSLADLRDVAAEPLRILRALFTHPDALKPQQTPAQITEAAASQFAQIARSMQQRIPDTERIAHFLDRLLFCFFAEDAELLPAHVLSDLLRTTRGKPGEFADGLRKLFALMADGGGLYGTQRIQWFNGGLFDDDSVLEFTTEELAVVERAASLNWAQVDPSVLGTLFERGLDPDKRGQLGAHYTDTEKIMMVVEPVVMQPLRREFDAMRDRVMALLHGRTPAPLTRGPIPRTRVRRPRWELDAEAEFFAFLQRLRAVRVLDPACGSGNFLYVTLKLLKDLEKEASQWASETLRITLPQPEVGPECVLGIELNRYAAELARVSVWIGHIQWMLDNGFAYERNPILRPLNNIECRDAILARDEDGEPVPAEWPEAEFIVGNPPFLGAKLLRRGLGHEYVEDLFHAWDERVPGMADLVCYWHELAREQIARGAAKRAGLLATNSIRGGKSRDVLAAIKRSGEIFLAWSDEPWVVEGAAVRVSIIAQDDGSEPERRLNGIPVRQIGADLTDASLDLTTAVRLPENASVGFVADVKGGAFDIDRDTAAELLHRGGNPNSRPNSDVVRPWVNGLERHATSPSSVHHRLRPNDECHGRRFL